jgi:uncharacterized protein
MAILIALVSGLLFGIGLIAGGMTDPHKIRAFLDVTGAWDPSLALVMGGALAVGGVAFARARQQRRAWAGFCPGPAWVAMASGSGAALWFVSAMLAGMALHDNALVRR